MKLNVSTGEFQVENNPSSRRRNRRGGRRDNKQTIDLKGVGKTTETPPSVSQSVRSLSTSTKKEFFIPDCLARLSQAIPLPLYLSPSVSFYLFASISFVFWSFCLISCLSLPICAQRFLKTTYFSSGIPI